VLRLVVAYDGTDFRGFAAQPGQRTVEGVLVEAMSPVLRPILGEADLDLVCAGRTDAGVHAFGQVVSLTVPDDVDAERLTGSVQRSINGRLAPEVVVRSADVVDGSFDARRSAQWRSYRYTVLNRSVPDPFRARHAWWVPAPLDLSLLRLSVDPFIGEHDFAAFCRKGPAGTTTMRRVLDAGWNDLGDGILRFDVRATAFCWQMVRSLVGTMVDVGEGRRRPGDLLAMLRSGDRARAGRVAPATGLCLWEVGY
jgi:tRNA pseudouridine38-40 synthase